MDTGAFEASWRAASCDAIPYHKDFPEWLTMIVELLNGGKSPSQISLSLDICGSVVYFQYQDNGFGCTIKEANDRLLRWASTRAVDGKSVYGHGTKKFLAKSGDYNSLKFIIRSRAKGEKKIVEWRGLYRGVDTHYDIVEDNHFPVHGFEIQLEVALMKLGNYNTPELVFGALKEIICARKVQGLLSTVAYVLTVKKDGKVIKQENSKLNSWKSLQETIHTNSSCFHLLHTTVPLVDGKVNLIFDSYSTGILNEIPGFPVYGKMTGGVGTRVHIFNEDTMIEAHPWYDIHDAKVHPSNWHRVDFVHFQPVDPKNSTHVSALPQPATTKVAYRYETEEWKQAVQIQKVIYQDHKTELLLPPKDKLKVPVVPIVPVVPTKKSTEETASPVKVSPVVANAKQEQKPSASPSAQNVIQAIQVAAATETSSQPVSYPVETIQAKHFDNNTTLNELYTRYSKENKSPEKFTLPKWLDCEDLLVYKENGKTHCIFYRQRQKGEVTHDMLKAYTALAIFANERALPPEKVTMIFCLHLKSSLKERTAQFDEFKKSMRPLVYPYIQSFQLKFLKDL